MTLRIGYIGLGALGRHLAGSLLRAGFPLTVYDVDASCAVELGKGGATCAESIAETARASDTIITCLPSPEAVASATTEATASGEGRHVMMVSEARAVSAIEPAQVAPALPRSTEQLASTS